MAIPSQSAIFKAASPIVLHLHAFRLIEFITGHAFTEDRIEGSKPELFFQYDVQFRDEFSSFLGSNELVSDLLCEVLEPVAGFSGFGGLFGDDWDLLLLFLRGYDGVEGFHV